MRDAGIESRGEFAFYFASRQEAEVEAGPAVAEAWEAAHAECRRGLAPMVRDLYRQKPAPCSGAREASSKSSASGGSQLKPPTLIRVPCAGVVRPLASALPCAEANAGHRACLVDILQKASRFASQLLGEEATCRRLLDAIVNPILVSAEEPTLRKVVRTWSELCEWAQRQGACVAELSAVQMAQFVLDSRAKSRVLPSLSFMRKHLRFAPELDLAHSFRTAGSAGVGHGARQAPVAQPPMVLLLEQRLVAAHKNRNPDWLAFFATWCQTTGCVRFVHLQRSRLIQLDQRTLLFECLRGKQRHLRAGFLWSCPRFSITGVDFGGMFLEALMKLEKPEAVKCVAFRVISGEELAPQAVRSQIGLAMSEVLPPAESRRVSSKCWRQVPVTLSLLGGLDATEVCALGPKVTGWKKRRVTKVRCHGGIIARKSNRQPSSSIRSGLF